MRSEEEFRLRIANESHKEIFPDSWLELLDNQTVCLKPKRLEDHSNPIGIVYHSGCGPSPGTERTFGSKGGVEALVRGYLLVRLSQEILVRRWTRDGGLKYIIHDLIVYSLPMSVRSCAELTDGRAEPSVEQGITNTLEGDCNKV
ncbi:hypothetical protein VNO77_22915 [Canavalia gladiata]|uniref:Uncharacterized protein n=1 Tax=Canavalia gladiata TaxID=3824 RepID=A0AAN9L8R1_CANGL